jgi:Tol biopolymer transport system component/C-terminal processing protease CtpA/Prc
MPSLSPDGKTLAFVYKGDVWTAPAEGGRATPVTQHVEMDSHPLFSPDGQWIAFSSRRRGSWDIFIVPAIGGTPRQVTYHGGADIATGWSPDSRKVLFSAKRDSVNYGLFALDLETLRSERLTEDYAPLNHAQWSADGQSIVYGRYGFPWTRPRYQGSAAAQIWVLNPSTGERHFITSNGFQHLWPRFLPGSREIVCVTVGELTPSASRLGETLPKNTDNARRTPNLWVFDLEGKGRPLTEFIGDGVRSPAVAAQSGDLAFEYGPDLYLLKSGGGQPQKIRLTAAVDEKQTTRRREKLGNSVTEAEPSPDGKTICFGLRGEMWSIATEKPKGVEGRSTEFARRLTDWAGEDADFVWAPDGKKLYFVSDREFNLRLYELEVATLAVKPLWNRPEDVTRLSLSPSGKELAFWVTGPEGGLHVLSLTNSALRRLAKVPGTHMHGYGGGDVAWSPDERWLAFAQRSQNRSWNLYLVPSRDGVATNITRLNAHHSQPAWSPDGKYLFFQSNRDGEGLYILPLIPEDLRSTDFDLKFEKPKEATTVKIDFTNLSERIRKFIPQNPQADLQVAPDGTILFLAEGDVWTVTYDGKETKRQTTGGGKSGLRLTRDGKRAFYTQNGELFFMKLDTKATEKVSFTADWERDIQAERQAAFTQLWRSFQRGFYDPNFHGRDWEGIRKRYAPLLETIETAEEFATLLNQLVGELESSHSEIAPQAPGVADPVTPQLGFTFDYTHKGPGIRVAGVPRNAPGSFPKTGLQPGDYVLAINGKDVTLDENLYRVINDQQDREFQFLVSKTPTRKEARTIKYKVMSQEEWGNLNYRNRTERLRQEVEQKSQGQLGYLHVSAMDGANQTRFEQEIYEYISGKEGMIIDVRFNKGGNILDTLIDWLERKQHGFFRPRDNEPEPSPTRAWNKPIIVLINEHSYSNGEMFPCAMRQRGLARLVGMPTPGYVIWTYPLRLVDGTGARMPFSGVYRLNGTPQENQGEAPDFRVALSPEDWLTGRDPQLDRAIELLLMEPVR